MKMWGQGAQGEYSSAEVQYCSCCLLLFSYIADLIWFHQCQCKVALAVGESWLKPHGRETLSFAELERIAVAY